MGKIKVGFTVPHVNEFARTAESLAAVARVTYLKDDAGPVKEVLDQVIEVVDGAEGSISNLILLTVDEAIEAGKLDASFKLLFVGLMGVVDSYLQFNDFDVEDILTILKAASNGLSDQVGTASSKGFDW